MEEEKAADYDKRSYMNFIKSIQSAEDDKYANIIQINAALENSKSWVVLKGMIETVVICCDLLIFTFFRLQNMLRIFLFLSATLLLSATQYLDKIDPI